MHHILVNNNQLIQSAKGISRYYFSIETYLRKDFHLEMLFDSPCPNPLRRKVREQFVSLRNQKYDILWSPSQMGPIKAANHVVTVHDLIPLHSESGISSLYRTYFKTTVGLLLRASKHIICISASVADIVQVYYGIRSSKITVIRNGYDFVNRPLTGSRNPPPPLEHNGYILFVGTISNHKNLLRLIESFIKFRKENEHLKLVIAGHFPSTISLGNVKLDFKSLETHGVLFYNHPDDAILHSLYAGCRGLIMPSLAEGFGLPIVEALNFGKPVICSDISVFRELFSGMVRCFFDPYDIDSISTAIKLLNDSQAGLTAREADLYSEQGRWTWEKAAAEYSKLFHTLS